MYTIVIEFHKDQKDTDSEPPYSEITISEPSDFKTIIQVVRSSIQMMRIGGTILIAINRIK